LIPRKQPERKKEKEKEPSAKGEEGEIASEYFLLPYSLTTPIARRPTWNAERKKRVENMKRKKRKSDTR